MHVPAFAYPYCAPNNKEPDMRDVKERLARLERENYHLRRQNRWTQLGVLVLGALVFLAAGYPETGGEIVVERLVLRDDQGRVRARLGIDGGGVLQRFFDATGTERIRLGITAEGLAQQRLFDQQGRVRVSSSTYPDDHPKAPGVAGSVYYDGREAKRIRLATDAEGVAVQQFKDGEGADRLATRVDPAGRVAQERR